MDDLILGPDGMPAAGNRHKMPSEMELKASSASYPDDWVEQYRGTPDRWAKLGTVNLKFPPREGEYFMRLNTTGWCSESKTCRADTVAALKRLRSSLEVLWNNGTKSWVIVGVEQPGAVRDYDLLMVLWEGREEPDQRMVDHVARKHIDRGRIVVLQAG